MQWQNVRLQDIEVELPPSIVTSEEIEKRLSPLYERLRLPEGRLELMTGIRERRVWSVGTLPSSVATAAAKRLFDKKVTTPQEIDLLIYAGVCRDRLEPATASAVHQNLRLRPSCSFFDLSNACLGMVNGLRLAADLIEKGTIKKALIVTGENSGPLLESSIAELLRGDYGRKDVKKWIANFTIGSAGVAALVSHQDAAPGAPKMLGSAVRVDSSASELCQGGGDINQLMMQTDSEALLKKGIVLAREAWLDLVGELTDKIKRPDWVVGHQVGRAHEEALLSALELKGISTHTTYQWLGNTGSAAILATLYDLMKTDKLQPGDKLALLGIGSGLICEMMGIEW